MNRSPFPCSIAGVLLAALVTSGCVSSVRSTAPTTPDGSAADLSLRAAPLSPAGSAGNDLFPLEVGDRWVYDVSFTTHSETGAGVTTHESSGTGERTKEISCPILNRGRSYVGLKDVDTERQVIEGFYRKDRAGVYRSNFISTTPECLEGIPTLAEFEAHRAATSSSASRAPEANPAVDAAQVEGMILAYPLFVGRTWSFDGPGGGEPTFRVEAREVIRTPLGMIPTWRIKEAEQGTPASSVHISRTFWYGRPGLVQQRIVQVLTGRDRDGAVTVRTTNRSTLLLRSFEPGAISAAR